MKSNREIARVSLVGCVVLNAPRWIGRLPHVLRRVGTTRPTFFALALLAVSVQANEVKVSDPESARKAVRDAKPGDVVVLAAGEWKDADLRLDGEGMAEKPITIRAEEPGKTVFTGASRVRLGGSHLVVSGLWLRNLSGAKADWLEFRIDSKRRANFCGVTDCALTESADFSAEEKENRWVGIYGRNNVLERCRIEGKKNKGTTVVVWLGGDDLGSHRIERNHFGERPRLGKNGGETIRVGDSGSSMMEAKCLVQGNLFFHCDGETEAISNKSCGNRYLKNWFVETQGTLTLRHGNGCLVEGNVFLGNHRPQTGGIRVIGEDHVVSGNFLRDLEGDDFRSAISLINGIPDSPANGYLQVKNAVLRDNVVLDCKDSILIGHNDEDEATLAPAGVKISGNRIRAAEGRAAVRMEKAASGLEWSANTYSGTLEGIEANEGLKQAGIDDIAFPEMPPLGDFGTTWELPGLEK